MKRIRWDFLCRLGHTYPRGCLGVNILFFSKNGHVAYQIEGDGEQNRINKLNVHPMVKLVTLRRSQ